MRLGITAVFAVATTGCSGREARPVTHATPSTDSAKTQENSMNNGARSPAGEAHPGQIVHDDKVDGRTWTRAAAEVPTTIAWVEVNGTWKPVVRIEITGTVTQRRITKFGPDGQMLETTIQAPPPPARR
jgi:hypothetical protein